jgi:hypothetical protein
MRPGKHSEEFPSNALASLQNDNPLSTVRSIGGVPARLAGCSGLIVKAQSCYGYETGNFPGGRQASKKNVKSTPLVLLLFCAVKGSLS